MAQRKAEVNHNQEFSDYALQKHQAMQNSAEFMQYEKAKQAHQIYNTPDTAYMVELCKKELRNTKECQEWLGAVEQEKQVIKNIQQSTTKHDTQKKPNFVGFTSKPIARVNPTCLSNT